MNASSASRAGLTLVELMISIALSAIIAYTAFSVVRLANQTITTANRLSVENGLFRAGFMHCLDQIDYWETYDSPTMTLNRGAGLPFAPASFTAEDDPAALNAHEPAAWFRGATTYTGNQGDYSLCAKLRSGPLSGLDDDRRRLPNALEAGFRRLGVLGPIEYLPANATCFWFKADGTRNDIVGGAAGISIDSASVVEPSRNPCDLASLTFCRVMAISADPAQAGQAAAWARRMPTIDTARTRPDHPLIRECTSPQELLPVKPTSWPELSTSLVRFWLAGREHVVARVRLLHPLTGATMELSFTAAGTTLRGARQQRGLDTH